MVWNKTSVETETKILSLLMDFSKRYSDIAQECGVSVTKVERMMRTLPKDVQKERYSKINHYAKLGDKNPMKGKTMQQHHRAVDVSMAGQYRTVWKPDWWKGHEPKGNRIFEHHLEWAKQSGMDHVPKGYVVHHKDENKLNNDPNNLVCITRREHAQIHCVENLLARCNDYPDKGVERRALEAQSILLGW